MALLLVTATATPPPGATAASVIVQVEVPVPVIAAGLQARPLSCAGAAVRFTEVAADVPFAVAVMATAVAADTVPAVAVKVAVVLPATTVTETGTERAVLLSEIATASPPVGAILFRVTVQVVAEPSDTVAGEQLSVDGTVGPTRLNVALAVALFRLTVNVAALSAVRVDAEAVKVAVEAPAATVTDTGSVTKALLSDSVTTAPPAGALPVNVTVHMADVPEPSAVGVQVRALSVTVSVKPIEAVFALPFNAAVSVAV